MGIFKRYILLRCSTGLHCLRVLDVRDSWIKLHVPSYIFKSFFLLVFKRLNILFQKNREVEQIESQGKILQVVHVQLSAFQ